MYLNTFDEVDQMGQELVTIHAASLYSEFEKVKDGRGKKGKRYPLPLLLTLLLLGETGRRNHHQWESRLDQREESFAQTAIGLAQEISRQFDL